MKRPHVTVKFAQTLDGRIAALDGSSRWISSPGSLKFSHRLRGQNDAVLVGVNTVLKDDPSLTTRLVKGKNPARVIIDGMLRIPLNSKIIKSAKSVRTIIVASSGSSRKRSGALEKKGVQVLRFPSEGSRIGLGKILAALYKKGIRKLLVEGGRKTITSFLKADMADKVIVVISPKLLGAGLESIGDLGIRSSIGSLGIRNIKSALRLRLKSVRRLGPDIIIVAETVYRPGRSGNQTCQVCKRL